LAKPTTIGGQAVIEGVMMRSKTGYAVCLRRKDHSVTEHFTQYTGLAQRHKLLRLGVVRGAVSFFETIIIGIKTLSYSADIALEDEKGSKIRKNWQDTFGLVISLVFALGLGLVIFVYLPLFLASFFSPTQNQFLFNFTAGFFRMVFLVLYMFLISFFPDVRRLFQYHGAEHKTIFAFEAEEELTVENTRKHSPHHPRCGTSFLLIAAIACVIMFGIVDAMVVHYWGPYAAVWRRFLVHLALLPLVSGISFEILRFSGVHAESTWLQPLIAPGLWLQKITTRDPDDSQLEIAISALKRVR
jgi:uncharacterized protein YqhQ